MKAEPLLALPEGLELVRMEHLDDMLVVTVVSTQISPCCPLCGMAGRRVHSHYQRCIADLPCAGQAIRLLLQVRKYFCEGEACPRKIFTERLQPFVEPWARVTKRLFQIVQIIGLATGGRLGVRVTDRLGIETTRHTILRRIMALPHAPVGAVTQVGIDDFSFRRGRKFGTILVDLCSHQVIDLLPERSAKIATEWLRAHPEIQYVSRDRGQDYAQAASEGAPQAVQISDRFHLMKNFVEAVEAEVSCCYKQLRHVAFPLSSPVCSSPEKGQQIGVEKKMNKQEQFEQVKAWLAQGLSALEVAERLAIPVRRVYHWKAREDYPAGLVERRSKQADKQDRCEHMYQLKVLGLSNQEIAERLTINERTVRRWQKRREEGTVNQPRRERSSIFDPYAAYVLSRWQQGERSVSRLFREIQEQGFSGSIRTIYRFIETLPHDALSLPLPTSSIADRVSVRKAIWLLVRPSEDLKAEEQSDLSALCQASPELTALHGLAQSFGQLLRKREGQRLDSWMKQVKESHFRHIKRFSAGLQRDYEEVMAGLTLPQSNGVVEGKVNKLKLIKRMGYGRASFPLLRQRVLHAL